MRRRRASTRASAGEMAPSGCSSHFNEHPSIWSAPQSSARPMLAVAVAAANHPASIRGPYGPRSLARSARCIRAYPQVVEPGVGLPVVDPEVIVPGALERVRIVEREERGGHVVDEPVEAVPLADELPVVALVGLDARIRGGDEVLAVLVEPRDLRLRVLPAAHDRDVRGGGVAALVGIEGAPVTVELHLDVAVGRAGPGVELDAGIARQRAAQPE